MADNFGMGDVDGSVTKVQECLSRQMIGSQGPTQPTILQNPEYNSILRINCSTVGGANTAAEIKYKGLPFQSQREHCKAPKIPRKMCHCRVTVQVGQGTR